jgi:hypothetical protein
MKMFAVCEKNATVGAVRSADNSRLWLSDRRAGHTTPASDEAAEFETRKEAEAAAAAAGLGDSWEVVEID